MHVHEHRDVGRYAGDEKRWQRPIVAVPFGMFNRSGSHRKVQADLRYSKARESEVDRDGSDPELESNLHEPGLVADVMEMANVRNINLQLLETCMHAILVLAIPQHLGPRSGWCRCC